MLPYLEIHREQLILMFGYGGLGLLVIALTIGWQALRPGGGPDTDHGPLERFRDGIEEGHGKIPLFLILLYIAVGIWVVIYIASHGSWGMDFGG